LSAGQCREPVTPLIVISTDDRNQPPQTECFVSIQN